MSHIVTVNTQLRDQTAIAAACRRLNLTEPIQGKAQMYAGEIEGLLVQLPGWKYPLAINVQTGQIQHDNFEGHWGDQEHLDTFMQAYAVELVRLEARKKGYLVSEQQLQDGCIKLQIHEG
jgi:hypothetical protein